ncbi:hypothetical protein [Zooshikella sp. RANM57]|uniref:hypothetical protein n=1 Tax=Zooshikella sp. RANM57 TaxID=3425863 RepID=UPI003D6F7DB2
MEPIMNLEAYSELTEGGTYEIKLTQDEACAVLKTHDYGVDNLTENDLHLLYNAVAKLKHQIMAKHVVPDEAKTMLENRLKPLNK